MTEPQTSKSDTTFNSERLVEVASRASEHSANILVAVLADENIKAVATGGYTSGFRAEAPGWVSVKTFEKDAARAKEILAELKAQPFDWSDTEIESSIESSDANDDSGTSDLENAHEGFSHLDDSGSARMVDVTAKHSTHRRAIARGRVTMAAETATAVAKGEMAKGDVLSVARVAGIQAAKRTSDLIPLCHPLLIGSVTVDFQIAKTHIDIQATVEINGPTGVEMEALTACSAAALTIYDMCKSMDKSMVIGEIALWEKTGGKSGTYRRDA